MAMHKSTARNAALISCVAIVIGSLGPWATTIFASKAGTSGDGVFTLILAVVTALLLLTMDPTHRNWRVVVGAGLGAVALFIAVYDVIDINSSTQTVFGIEAQVVKVDWGLWLTALASAALIVSCWLLRREAPRQPAPPQA